jgi:hypothetical protein
VEYPWEGRDAAGDMTWLVPAEHPFRLLSRMHTNIRGYQLPQLLRRLFERFDAIF